LIFSCCSLLGGQVGDGHLGFHLDVALAVMVGGSGIVTRMVVVLLLLRMMMRTVGVGVGAGAGVEGRMEGSGLGTVVKDG
jgi:hypothetical protein